MIVLVHNADVMRRRLKKALKPTARSLNAFAEGWVCDAMPQGMANLFRD
jgi:hypothetical protein